MTTRASSPFSAPFLAPILDRIAPLAFTLGVRAEAWRLVADLLAARLDVGQALGQAADIYRLRGMGLAAHVLSNLRGAIGRGVFAEEAARLAPGAESLLFARFGRADAGRIFEGAARIARAEIVLRRAILQAVARPLLLLALTLVLYYILGTRLFPTLEEIAPRAGWPLAAQLIASLAEGLVAHLPLLAAGALGLALALRHSLSRDFPGRRWLDRFPPWSLYKLRVGSAFLFAIVETARTGGEIKTSTLRSMAEGASPYVRDRLTRIADELAGGNLGQAATRAGQDFPARDLNAILAIVAAQDGWVERFAAFLERWIADIEERVRRTTAILNVTLMLAIALSFAGALTSLLTILETIR